MFLGGLINLITSAVTLSGSCFAVSLYLVLGSILVGMLEAPVLFQCSDQTKAFVQKLYDVKSAPRAILYVTWVTFVLSLPEWGSRIRIMWSGL